MITRLTHKILLAIVCCFALVCVVPLTASAQGGIINKGAQGVKKGVETGAEKTKEGVETGVDKTKEGAKAVGRETKEVFTGDKDNDNDTQRMKSSESSTTTTTQEPSQTETTKKSRTTTSKSTTAGSTETQTTHKRLPATAGELPLLGLIGALALLASGTPKLIRLRR
jgi:hypothetical protein